MADTIRAELVTPEKMLFSEDVMMVELPASDGDMGVLPGHAPVITTLKPGIVTLHLVNGEQKKLFLCGGMAEVSPERVTLLAEQEIDYACLTREDVQLRLTRAQERHTSAVTDPEKSAADGEVKIAEALLAVIG